MATCETRASGEVPAVVERRPGTAVSGHRSERERSSPWPDTAACALEERRPRHSSSPQVYRRCALSQNRRGARRNRRAPGASSGGKHGCDERSRSEQTCFSPVVGDRKIADVFAGNPGHCTIRESICVNLRDLRAYWDGWVVLRCLRVFVSSCLRRGLGGLGVSVVLLAWDYSAVSWIAPPQEEPAPAVQPKQ